MVVNTEVDLPEGKTWADVAEWYVKWATLHYRLEGSEDWAEAELGTDFDWDLKRPSFVEVLELDEDGLIIGAMLAEV
jgi:hypothetical protein